MRATANLERKRSVEEASSYAVGHRIRIEILGILNQGTHCPSELAKMIHQPLTTISHHIKELLDSGCIELVRVKKVRNVDQHFYRTVDLPFLSDEDAAELPAETRQEFSALVLQSIMAESLSSLWAGKLHSDPKIRMLWCWFHLDQQGRQELADELHESWERVVEIEARSFNRTVRTGEEPMAMIVAMMGFERSRPVSATAPATQHIS